MTFVEDIAAASGLRQNDPIWGSPTSVNPISMTTKPEEMALFAVALVRRKAKPEEVRTLLELEFPDASQSMILHAMMRALNLMAAPNLGRTFH